MKKRWTKQLADIRQDQKSFDEEEIKEFGGPGRHGRRCRSRGEVGAGFNVQLTGGRSRLKVESTSAAVVAEKEDQWGAWARRSATLRKNEEGLGEKVGVGAWGTYMSAWVESRYEPPITVIFTQLGVQCHRSCTKRPPGTSCRPVSSSGASRVCFVPTGKSTHALLPKPPQARSLVSWESNATGPARKFHPDQLVQPRQARLPVGSASRPDCTDSGLFFPAEPPDSLCHFSDSFLVFRG
ncbi:hypothetical protein CRG98_021448 [Punica granatum]|uniref:Uncharacterized protein n=1 Tax=Punica granatum TaxID=22663 RepID=A0A2I0JQH9_PUNGR|nr:hypothetical protein CRG98_021448 [Punica granatum]